MEIVLQKAIPIILIIIFSMIAYFLRKWLKLEDLKPIIAEVAKLIMDVERTQKECSGESKMDMVKDLIEVKLPVSDIIKIKKSPFKSIGRFAQYVFTTVAEQAILSRLKGR